MKRGIKIGLFAAFVALQFYSCTNSTEVKIGLLVPSLDYAYMTDTKKYFEESAKNMGAIVVTYSADNNEKLQIQQADELIAQGVDVIVIDAVNSNSAAAIVRNAHEANIQVLAYDRIIMNCDLDYYISYDSEKVGQLMAEYALKNSKSGNYVLLYGDGADHNAHAVKKGILGALDGSIRNGAVNIMYQTYIEDWSKDVAYKKLSMALSFSELRPDVIISSYDGMSEASIMALENEGINSKVLVTGQNGELNAFRNIMQGKQAMTMYKPVKDLAEKSAQLAISMAKGLPSQMEEVKISNNRIDVKSILLDPILIDGNNIDRMIVEKGIYSKMDLLQAQL